MPIRRAEREALEIAAFHVAASRREQRELLLGDRRNAREMPILVLRGRKSEGGKSLERGASNRLRGSWNHRLGGQRVERRRVRLARSCHHRKRRARHAAAPAGSITQSYPLSSSSSARSFPPDFMIRPPASTCTKSGTM